MAVKNLKINKKHEGKHLLHRRVCPACGSSDYLPLLKLCQDDFVPTNHTYNRVHVKEMGFSSDEVFEIVCCSQCGFQYTLTRLSQPLLRHLYEKVIDREKSRVKTLRIKKRVALLKIWTRLFTLAVENAQEPLNLHVLDYGCGWGDFLAVASAPGVHCVGFEIDSRKIAQAREWGVSVFGDEGRIDECAPFDIIFCNQVLEHVPEPNTTIKKLSGWLKAGGYGWLAVPHCSAECIVRVKSLMTQGKPIPKEFNPWEHLNYFDRRSFVSMLREHGLEIVPPTVVQKHSMKWSLPRFMRGAVSTLLPRFGTVNKVLSNQQKEQELPEYLSRSITLFVRKK